MHETLRPHVTKILSHTINDPNPRHMPSDTVEFTFNLTTLDATKHTAVTLPFKNQAVRQPPSGTIVDEPTQQLTPKQLAEPFDGKDAGVIAIRVNNEGDSQPVFRHEGEDIMSDDEDTIVQETLGVHEGMMKLERAAHDDHEEIECAVCLCKIEEEEMRELRCSHLFHQSCLDAWTAYKYATCPICRDSIAPPRLVTELGEETLFFNFCSFSSTSQRDKWWLR
ncbi:hypothetical protein WN944_019921 [Citrus x changshan-huyou]|uniref:RING-type domain-containing protein n=1 Tax=Citrus x changshan-huyou TaxID=2935761 RepID=A0AAP0LWW4_9ROSI